MRHFDYAEDKALDAILTDSLPLDLKALQSESLGCVEGYTNFNTIASFLDGSFSLFYTIVCSLEREGGEQYVNDRHRVQGLTFIEFSEYAVEIY